MLCVRCAWSPTGWAPTGERQRFFVGAHPVGDQQHDCGCKQSPSLRTNWRDTSGRLYRIATRHHHEVCPPIRQFHLHRVIDAELEKGARPRRIDTDVAHAGLGPVRADDGIAAATAYGASITFYAGEAQ